MQDIFVAGELKRFRPDQPHAASPVWRTRHSASLPCHCGRRAEYPEGAFRHSWAREGRCNDLSGMRPTVQCPSGIAPDESRCGSSYGNLAWAADASHAGNALVVVVGTGYCLQRRCVHVTLLLALFALVVALVAFVRFLFH